MSAVLDQLPRQLFWQILRYRWMAYVAFVAPWIVLASPIGITIALALILLESLILWRQVQGKYVSWLDAHFPELEDSARLLSANDKQSGLATLQRARLATRLSGLATPEKLRHIAGAVLPWRRAYLVLSWVLAAVFYGLNPNTTLSTNTVVPQLLQQTTVAPLRLYVSPPAYTQIPAFESEAKALQVPEHSHIRWCFIQAELPQTASSIRLSNGQELPFVRVGQDACADWEVSETVFWTWSADPKQTRFTLTVQLDQVPEISIKEPVELVQVLETNAKYVAMQVQVSDDYQVVNASLHLTLARGSGENIRFSDKEVPLPQGADKRSRDWQKRWSLAELGMEPGDELVFFVRAIDNAAKNPHIVRSPTYTIRLPAPDAVAEELSVLPILAKPESLRSQRQIIIDTEQLVADMAANPKLSAPLIRNRSETIANDQAALRRRYGRFLGEESSLFGDEHEHGEHGEHGEHDNDKPGGDLAAQYGHAHDQEENATLFDEATKKILRRALVAMWDAEKSLRAITPKAALPAENKALEAIKQLQQADRIYLHKAAFTPPAIKEEKRLSGDVVDVRSQQRKQALFDDPVTPQLKELLLALGTSAALPALWTQDARRFIAQQLPIDSQRLQAQAAVQDVAEGCQPCRAVLAAWLRQGIQADTMRLQARPVFKANKASQFEQRWESSRPISVSTSATRNAPTSAPTSARANAITRGGSQ